MTRSRRSPLVFLAVALCALGVSVASGAARDSGTLDVAKSSTARFRDVSTAKQAGYALLRDAASIACIDKPGVGAMGDHYVRKALVGNATVDARTPEALVYQPLRNGRLQLVAVEYIVFKSAWDAGHKTRPSLFGRTFELVGAGNRYGLPPFYELHAWIWKQNPRGLFDDWNPRATCAFG